MQASHQLKPNSLRFVLGKPFLEEGKGMDDRSPEVRFALDSPLEGAVSSELVSERQFPWLLGKIQGIQLESRRDRL